MNWIAIPIALVLLVTVSYHIYQRHFVVQQSGVDYQFDDLPGLTRAPVTANIKAIVDAHIFGVIPQKPAEKPAVVIKKDAKPVPKTRLNIKLTGIIDGDSPESGIAMLEVDRGRTLVVAVGEKIGKTDAVLHQVLPGEVLVDRNGTIESVKMVRKTLSLAKLDPALENSLPQPYTEQADEQGGGGREYTSGSAETSGSQKNTINIRKSGLSRSIKRFPSSRNNTEAE